ncbi:hypothetical protein HBA54_01010 [Pelagibius litoralis]|uniref:Oxygen tolerance n=1 Tax=Pelagibius litoralis TaxID=374515 RepID=A0A967C5Z4_9PROT|nr:hypothetical protein [Pelagibius litoralis]NIA67167.1 hypothetical protein [Pelagibius litoralis]
MRRSLLGISALLIGLACMLIMAPASQAQTLNVTVTPDRAGISLTGPSTVTVVWQLTRLSPTALPGTSSSPNAQLFVGGLLAGTVGGTLSRSFTGAGGMTEVRSATETIVIPQGVAFRAVKSGAPILLTRTFTDTSALPPDTAAVALFPTGPGSEPFSISRLSLTFDDRSRVKVLPKGSRLRAVAEINTTGTGLIVGQWEYAPATTTAGTPIFRPLALVRQNVAGGRRVLITSPALPTRFEGTNLVRLNITEPGRVFDEPELQYYVTPESPLPDQQEPRLLLITSPSEGTPLTQTTRFAWQAVPGAEAYKLELYRGDPGPAELPVAQDEVVANLPLDPAPDAAPSGNGPLTGIVLPGAVTETRLKDFTLAHLPPDRRYRWMVKAIGKDGVMLGASEVREIYKP